MDKYDIKKVHKGLYSPSSRDFTVVDVPDFQYIVVDGRGDPNTSSAYAHAIEALYGVAYTVKFANKQIANKQSTSKESTSKESTNKQSTSKKTFGRDFVVAPLEGLWRANDPTVFTAREKESWEWTMMISQPDWITADMVGDAVDSVAKKKGNPALGDVRLRTLSEGTSVQILHIGSYDDETPTLHRLHHQFMPENGLTFNGDHHEIYLSDPRRTAPAKLKTILRQPVKAG